jgi:hypothetical protein
MDYCYKKYATSFIDKLIASNVIPAISYTTLTSSFNFVDRKILKHHASVFIGAVSTSFIFGLAFLKPIDIKDICVGGEIQNNNANFKHFKNMFILGQMIIGISIVLAYICIFGGKIGIYLVISIFVILAIVYLLLSLIADKSTDDDNDLVEYM